MKSISFLFAALIAGLFFIACKDAKTTENTDATTVVITADSLQGLKVGITQSLTTMQSMVAEKITAVEADIAATNNETAKQELNTFLDKLKKVQTDLQASATKVADATADSWAAIEGEIMPILVETKSLVTTGGLTTSPTSTTTTAEKK
jgi:hypothetical protein